MRRIVICIGADEAQGSFQDEKRRASTPYLQSTNLLILRRERAERTSLEGRTSVMQGGSKPGIWHEPLRPKDAFRSPRLRGIEAA
jgi:hypothetical protein